MNLAKQVVAVPLAHRLKELGLPQSALFFWLWAGDTFQLVRADELTPMSESCAAFTVAELGELLRACIEIPSFSSQPGTQVTWRCKAILSDSVEYSEEAHTEADARGKLIIYLLENKLLSLTHLVELTGGA